MNLTDALPETLPGMPEDIVIVAMQLTIDKHAESGLFKYQWKGPDAPIMMHVGWHFLRSYDMVQVQFVPDDKWFDSTIRLNNDRIHNFTYHRSEHLTETSFAHNGHEWTLHYATKLYPKV